MKGHCYKCGNIREVKQVKQPTYHGLIKLVFICRECRREES